MADETEKKQAFKVKTSDGKTYELDDDVVSQCELLKSAFADDVERSEITLESVNSVSLEKVIEYCKRQSAGAKAKGKSSEKWDEELIGEDTDVLYFLVIAANYLEHKELLDKCCKKIANIISGRTPEQIRRKLNIKNDLTPEEEKEHREKYYWAYEKLGRKD